MNMNKKSFQFKAPQKILIESLIDLKSLHSPTASENYTRFTFFAKTICSFPEYLEKLKEKNGTSTLTMSHKDALNLAFCLSEQLFHLENRGGTYLSLDKNKIYVVDETTFICLDDQIIPFQPDPNTNTNTNTNANTKTNNVDKLIKITSPFSKNDKHLAPELKTIDKLPTTTSHKAVYYSLGSLIVTYLIPLEQLFGTKLYSFLQRCLENDPNERTLIYL